MKSRDGGAQGENLSERRATRDERRDRVCFERDPYSCVPHTDESAVVQLSLIIQNISIVLCAAMLVCAPNCERLWALLC